MALVLTVNAVDRTSVLEHDTLSVEHRAAGFVSVCSFTLVDEDHDVTISAEDDISVVDGATTFFSGRVVEVIYRPFTSSSRYIRVMCQDLNAQLQETTIDDEEVFSAEADADIIDALFDEYLPAVDSDTHVATIQDPLTITLGPCSMRSALSQICTRTGGYFYVDFDNRLHYFDAEADVIAWWLSDVPDQVDSFSYFELVRKELTATTRLDGVFVIGDGVSGWRGTHGAGDRTALVRDNRITTATGVNNRGDAILNKYGYAQVVYYVSTYKQGLAAGQDIRFICALYDVDDTFTVRVLTVKWDGSGDPYYELELGAPVNPSLTDGQVWIDVIEANQGPVSAPRLPTSSRGWSHDLEFSATDFDTVGWAGVDKIYLADGTEYTIDAGNTGNMAADTVHYIYLDLDTSVTVLQVNADSSVAVGSNKLLIAVAAPVADEDTNKAIFQVFGGEGVGVMITADNIVAETITGNEIQANAIAAGHIVAGTITANEIAANTIKPTNLLIGGFGDQIFSQAYGLLLLGPFCEINATEWWTLRRQKATITGGFHQEAGYWQGTKGLVVEEPTTNLVTNPSFEVNVTDGWTLDAGGGGGRVRVTTRYAVGSACCRLDAGNGGNSLMRGPTQVVVNGESIAVQARMYRDHSGTVRLSIFDSTAGIQRDPQDMSKIGEWELVVCTWTNNTGSNKTCCIEIQNRAADNASDVWFDACQMEHSQAYATGYCDGSLGAGYVWDGAVHFSESTRTTVEVNLDAYAHLAQNNSAMSFRIIAQALYDHDVTWPASNNFLWYLYEDGDNRIYVYYMTTFDRLSIVVEEGNVPKSVYWSADFNAGDWLDIVLNVDFAGDAELFINGASIESIDISALSPITPLTQWNLGSDYAGANQGGWNIAEYSVFDRVLTADEVAMLYEMNRPTVDAGAMDVPGIYILDGRFRMASSTTGNRIEITSDEIAGYDGAGAKQFYLRSSDGKAYCGGGVVRLDDDGVTIVATAAAGAPETLYLKYESGGTEYIMGEVYSDWAGGGGDEANTWVTCRRHAGSPWPAGVEVQIAAIDDLAGDDVRVIVKSEGIVTIYGANYLEVTGGGDVRIAGGLYVGAVNVDPDAGDIWCTSEISTDGGVARWNLGVYSVWDPTPDGCIRVQINGVSYDIPAEAV